MRRLLAIGLCCIITGLTAPAQSQVLGAASPDSPVAPLAAPDTATLLVGNRAIATFRSSFGAQSAGERGERAASQCSVSNGRGTSPE